MTQIRTAKGRMIDMDGLAKQNEATMAVSPGNVRMNARGDRIGPSGNVLQTTQTISRAVHTTTQAPQKKKLNDPLIAASKPTKKEAMTDESNVVRQEKKTMPDGKVVTEIEYDDGSIEIKEDE